MSGAGANGAPPPGHGPPHGGHGPSQGGQGGHHDLLAPDNHDEHHEEPEEAEQWLISYADLMTLLFGLFALMFSFAKFDDDKATVKVDKALAKYFGQSALSPTDAHSKKPPDQQAPDKPEDKRDEKSQDVGNYTGLAEQMKVELERAKATKEATFKQAPDGYEINFVSSLLFASGRAELTPAATELLGKLGGIIKATNIKYQIRVEGHTDDNPIHSEVFPSNWELSAARAATILRVFEGIGFEPIRLMAVGYGSSRPAYPNRSPAGNPIPENQSLNRRVVIKVLVPEDGDKDSVEPAKGADAPADKGAKPAELNHS